MPAVQRSMWSKVGKYVSALVIACFFLPFFGISCKGMDVITVSGADMVGGCQPGGVITAAEKEGKMTGGSLETKIDDVAVEPFAIAALALVLVMFGLSLVPSKSALRATLVVAVLASGTLVALYMTMRGELMEVVEKETAVMSKEKFIESEISAGGRMGLWLVGIGLLSVIGMTASALVRKPEVMPPQPIPPVV